jgi:glucokinase
VAEWDTIGVDLGGTKLALAHLHGDHLGESVVAPTESSSADALIAQLVEMVQNVGVDGLDGVGVGVPSIVEFASGRVVRSVNVPLSDVPLREVLRDRLGVPVFVDNDATVAALAEAHDEHLRLVAHHLVLLTIGTGVGGGVVLNGRIYRGATGGAGELGHTIIGLDLSQPVPRAGKFPLPQSLEWAAAGVALDRLAEKAAEDNPDFALGRLRAAGEPVSGREAVEAARDGDRVAVRIVELWGERLGIGIANVINTFDPDEVVVGGGAAQAGELLLGPAERVARAHVVPGLGAKTRIRAAWHGVRAGVLGAALLAVQELQASGVESGARAGS